ncbi:MAG: hypothetical protein AAFP08_00970 [Bacteroidota bacterium]
MRLLTGLLVLTLSVLPLTEQVHAQLRLQQINLSKGFDQDMLGDMSGSYLIEAGRQSDMSYDYSELNLEPQDAYSWICENPHFRLGAIWVDPTKPGLEIGTNLLLITGRIDEMSYRGAYTGYGTNDYLHISQQSNELAVEATIGYRLSGRSAWALTPLAGVNFGYHWGDVSVYGSAPVCNTNQVVWRSGSDIEAPCASQNIYDIALADGGISARAWLGIEGSVLLFNERIELGATLRRGLGLRTVGEAPVQTTQLDSWSLSLGYNLFRQW